MKLHIFSIENIFNEYVRLSFMQNIGKYRSHQSFLLTYQQSVLARLERLEGFIRNQMHLINSEVKKIIQLLHTGTDCLTSSTKALCVANAHFVSYSESRLSFQGLGHSLQFSNVYLIECFPNNQKKINILSNQLVRLKTDSKRRKVFAGLNVASPYNCIKVVSR